MISRLRLLIGLLAGILLLGTSATALAQSAIPGGTHASPARLFPAGACAPGHTPNLDGSCTAVFPASFDGEIEGVGSTFFTAHDLPVGGTVQPTANLIRVETTHYPTLTSLHRGFLAFDTHTLPDSAEVNDAQLRLYVSAVHDDFNDGADRLRVLDATPASANGLSVNDYSHAGPFTALIGTDVANPADLPTLTTGTKFFSFTPFGKKRIQKNGTTVLSLLENHDATRQPPMSAPFGVNGIAFYAQENPSNAPALIVTYRTNTPAFFPAPTLTASQGTFTDRVELAWTPIPGAGYYSIHSNTDCTGTPVQILSAPATQATVFLSPNVLRYFSVKAINGECSTPEPGFGLGAPSNMSAGQGAPAQIALEWELVANASRYHIYRGINGPVNPSTPIASVDVPAYTDTGVTPGTPIHYAVKAQNGNTYTPLGNEAIGYLLAPPSGISASDNQINQVQLDWSPPAGASGYHIYKHFQPTACAPPIFQTIGAASTITLPAAPNAVEYYSMKTISPAGVSADCSNVDAGVALDANAAPQPPINVRASDDYYTNKVQVRWDPVAGASGYQVYRNMVNDSATAALLGSPASNLRNDASASEGITYYYWVKTLVNGVPSAFSAGDAGRRAWGINSLLAGDGTQSGNIQLNWTNSQTGTLNTYYRSTLHEACNPNTTQGTLSPSPGGLISTNPGPAQGIVPGTPYYFSVGAKQQAGGLEHCSKPEPGYAGTLTGGAIPSVSPPGASDGTYLDKVQVFWTASPGADNYIVYRNTSNNFAGASVLAPAFAGVTYNDFTALANVDYYYWVAAHRNAPAADSPVSYFTMGFRV